MCLPSVAFGIRVLAKCWVLSGRGLFGFFFFFLFFFLFFSWIDSTVQHSTVYMF